jgi:hypothetical protein
LCGIAFSFAKGVFIEKNINPPMQTNTSS